ncbi:MAG: pilus assembly protein PilM [Planctomycetota bacterium]|nr:pilus assembly protein PilM [Planctomycetota bacterium]
MWNTWFNSGETIGCDGGGGYLRLAQVQGMRQGRPRLVVAERELPQLPDEDPGYAAAVGNLLRDMVRSAPFRGARIVSCLPARAMHHRTMRLAPMPEQELPQAAHWKAAAELGIKPDALKSAVLISATIREGAKQKTEALVVAAPIEELDRHLAILQRAALKPVAIDASVCAVARCLGSDELWGADVPPQRVILELRQDATMLAVVGGTELAFARPVGEGLALLDQMLGDLLEVPAVEAHKLYLAGLAAPAADAGDHELAPGFVASRVREAIADASRMYGRELARQVALSMHYYATTFAAAPPEIGTVVSDRAIDAAGLEAVTVQSGIDFTVFDVSGTAVGAQLQAELPGAELGAWAAAIGLSLYEHGLTGSRKVA